MPDCILPVRPKTLEDIFSGRAHVLPRRVMPRRIMEGERIYLYCNRELHGHALVRGLHPIDNINLWAIARASALTESTLLEYWAGAQRPGYFVLGEVYRFPKPRPWQSKIPLQTFVYV